MKFSDLHKEVPPELLRNHNQMFTETLKRAIDMIGSSNWSFGSNLEAIVDRNLGKAIEEAVKDLGGKPHFDNEKELLLIEVLIQMQAAKMSADEFKRGVRQ